MINHARTLLRNSDGLGFIDRAGEEYTPPEFRRVAVPSCIYAVKNFLFGRDPDWLMTNYRLRQYMTLLHSTELEEFVLQHDSRITYRFDKPDLFTQAFVNTITKMRSTSENLTIIDEVGSPDAAGRCYHAWRLEVLDGDLVRVISQTKPLSDELVPFTASGNLSSLVPLPGSNLSVRFVPTVGNRWRVQSMSRPTTDLGDLVASIEQLGESAFIDLFGRGDSRARREPWITFANLWYEHRELPYRLGGLLLAIIFTTHAIRETGRANG